MTKKRRILNDYFKIALGAFALAAGIELFLAPLRLSTGGVSGVATVIYYVFGTQISVSSFAINSVLFVFGFKTLGKRAIVKTAAGIALLSLFFEFFELISEFLFFFNDVFIGAVFGGVLSGVGIGLTVMCGASTGGSDFAALMLAKRFPRVSPTKFMLFLDFTVIVVSGIVFGDFAVMFYSVISLYISVTVAERILISGESSEYVVVISEKSEIIAEKITTVLSLGVTGIYGFGFWSGRDGIVLICVAMAKEIPLLLECIYEIDKNAFTVVTKAREVRGSGFEKFG